MKRDSTPDPELREVEARLRDLRRRKKVRWTMSRETAEMAIAAIATGHADKPYRPSRKSRRRKRGKRLL